MNENPLVTVLMPVYNGEKYLNEAIDSIISQTYKNFELLIIDDGSTDNSKDIIQSYNDSRIRLICNPKNLKLIATLNKGIELSKGKYIARMDCDDISFPRRLEKQVEFLEKKPDVIVCGTGIKILGSKWRRLIPPTGWGNIKYKLLINNCVSHPTVMLRASTFKENNIKYDPNYLHAEDYELWVRLSENYKIENIREPLLNYRYSPTGIGRTYSSEQFKMAAKISNNALAKYYINFNREEFMEYHLSKEKILDAKNKIEKIELKEGYEREQRIILSFLWIDLCKRGAQHGIWTIKTFYSIKNVDINNLSAFDKLKFLIRSTLKMEY